MMIRPLLLTAVLLALPLAAQAGNPARQSILDQYAQQARQGQASFDGFSAAAGEKLFRGQWSGGDARTPSCVSCHTEDPRQPGRNAKTGRAIDPVAVSANPSRFTDWDLVEKQFVRDCKSVLGRACTAQEKGDYITFMQGQ